MSIADLEPRAQGRGWCGALARPVVRWLGTLTVCTVLVLSCGRLGSAPEHAEPTAPGAVAATPVAVRQAASQNAHADAGTPTRARSPKDALASPQPEHVPTGTTELPVTGFLPSLVSWPDARRWPQPVLFAAHGAGDAAEYQCEFWRQLVGQRGVIVCLRGRALRKSSPDHGFYFPDHLTLEREALAALDSLARLHPELADPRRIIYAGYSQGAQMGMLMLLGRGALAPRLLLNEGGAGDWTAARAQRFKKSGGERVALVCGTPGCNQNAERSAAALRAAGLWSAVHYAPGGGHTYGGSVSAKNALAFAELTRGDARWEP